MYFDSSAFAKRYVEEKGSDVVEQLCREATELALSVLCVPEIISALSRRVREGSISPTQYREAKSYLSAEVADATIVNLIPDVVAEAIRVLENNAIRATDALHIACALQWNAEIFISADERQLSAAIGTNLRTQRV